MIAKAVKGRGFRGAIAYDLGKDAGRILDTNMAGESVPELSAEFGAIRKLRPNLERAVLHVSLSAAPGEKLTDAQWADIGRRYLEGMEFLDNQYLVTRHTDTEHEHIHILANRITHTGEVVSDSKDYERQEVLMRSIEREFHLQQLRPSIDSDRRAPTRGEIEKHLRTSEASTRIQLQQLADAAAKGTTTYTEYQRRLESSGVELIPVLQQGGAKLSGLMYRLDDTIMKGSDLGKGYSPAGLAKRGVTYEQDRDAEAVRRSREREEARGAEPGREGQSPQPGQERGRAGDGDRAPGQGFGDPQQRSQPDPDRDRAEDQSRERRLPAPDQRGERQPRTGDPSDQASHDRAQPGRELARLEPLRPGDHDRSTERTARERILGLVQSADRAEFDRSQGGGREPEAGGDRSAQERQRGQADQRQVAADSPSPSAFDRLVELARVERERDERVRKVLAHAQQREARRAEAHQALNANETAARVEQNSQAAAAWEAARRLAKRLVEQASYLVLRLKELVQPERVLSWAREAVKRVTPPVREQPQPKVVATAASLRDRPPASRSEEVKVEDPKKLTKADVAKLPLADQSRLYDLVLDKLELLQKARIERINAKSQERLQRRQAKAQQVRQARPPKPNGLLAPLKQSGYQRDYDRWLKRDYAARILVDAAERLNRNLRDAKHHSRYYAVNKFERIEPALAQRVQNHRQLEQRDREQRKQAEHELKQPQKDRGRSL